MDLALFSGAWWAALGSIIWLNIILSGDNAVVIAMAARRLPDEQRQRAIFWGSAAAIVLRVALTLVAAQLLRLPYMKIVGAILLVYIGVQLLADEDDGDTEHKAIKDGMMAAVRTILIADLVMSLDNVMAVAAASKNDHTLLILGLALSIPLIIFGSTLLMKIMDRFPIIVTLGAALLGFLAGEMFVTDPALGGYFEHLLPNGFWFGLVGRGDAEVWMGLLGAAIVLILGFVLKKRNAEAAA